jgi:hypothetical protein
LTHCFLNKQRKAKLSWSTYNIFTQIKICL